MAEFIQEPVETGLARRRFIDTGTIKWLARHAGSSQTFDTRSEAEAWLADRRQTPKADRVQLKADVRITGEMLHALLDTLRTEGKMADSTISSRRKVIDGTLADWLKKHRWTTQTLTHTQIADYLESVEHRGPSAYNHALRMVQVLGRELVRRRFRLRNPVPKKDEPGHEPHFVAKPEGRNRRREDAADGTRTSLARKVLVGPGGSAYMMDWPEVQQIIGMVQCGALATLWYQALALTGARPSELSGTRWADVDLDDDVLWLIHPVPEQNGVRYWRGRDVSDPDAPKYSGTQMKRAGDTGRHIPISGDLKTVLSQLLTFRRDDDPVGWLFCGRMTEKAKSSIFGSLPMSYEWTQQLLRKATVGTKWEGISQYDLRHHYASRRLAEGVSLFDLAKDMGTSMQEIELTYGHKMRKPTS